MTAEEGLNFAGVGPFPKYRPHPGPLWEREGYASERGYLDDCYRQTFGHEPPPLPTSSEREIGHLQLPGFALSLHQRQMAPANSQSQVLDSASQRDQTWIVEARLRQPRVLNGLLGKIFRSRISHPHTPSVARVPARYVAGAFLVALQQLQRRAQARRAAVTPRPSGTANSQASS